MKMKKLLSVILAAVMLLGCMSVTAFADGPATLTGFAGGDGSAENPYQIATLAQLENLADIVNGGNGCADTYFVLTADIGTSEMPVTKMIMYSDSAPWFGGNFDGQNHTVTLNINTDGRYAGLFGICGGATITNVTTAGSVTGASCVGGLCAWSDEACTISNCHNTATITFSSDDYSPHGYVGGLCGLADCRNVITNCSNSGTVYGVGNVGGLCGISGYGTLVANCYNTGAVSGSGFHAYIGGICGIGENMINCFNTGAVSVVTGDEPMDDVNADVVCGQVEGSVSNCFYDSSVASSNTAATGLTTEQCKAATGTTDALVDKLNNYTDESGSYPEGWFTWAIDETTGYPTLLVPAPEEPGNDFLTSFTLNKDYDDKYTADTKSTKVNETVSFTITPVTTGAPAFTNSTFTIDVDDGVGSADVDLPGTDDIDSVGDYWYKIEETAGTTAGVTYDDTTYYLHLIVSYKNGEFGFSAAAIHTTENGEGDDDAKITLVSNSYGEGSLTVGQVTNVNGEDNNEDTFEATVTFTLPEDTELCGDITYGDNQKVTFDENGVGTVTIELKGGDTVTFYNIPDGVTYTVEQSEGNEDMGYTLDSVEFDNEDEDGDTVTDLIASGTISDLADTVTLTNSKSIPIDVGVILENGAFIILALGAIAFGAWLVISKRKSVDAE